MEQGGTSLWFARLQTHGEAPALLPGVVYSSWSMLLLFYAEARLHLTHE